MVELRKLARLFRAAGRAGAVAVAATLLLAHAVAQDEEVRIFGKTAGEFAAELASGDREAVFLASRQLYLGRKNAIPILRVLMRDERAGVRYAALQSFHSLIHSDMEPILLEALSDEDGYVRGCAYRGLYLQGPKFMWTLKRYVDGSTPLTGSVARFGPVWAGGRYHFCIQAFDWSPDGSALAVGDGTGRITIWNWREDTDLLYLRGREKVEEPLDWSPDGGWIFAGRGAFGDVLVTRRQAGEGTPVPRVISRGGSACSWSPDSKRYAVGGRTFPGAGFLSIVGVDGEIAVDLEFAKKYGEVSSVEFSRDGERVAVATSAGRVAIVDLQGEVRWLPPGAIGEHASWSPDGTRLALSGWDRDSRSGRISVVTAADGEPVWSSDLGGRVGLGRCEWCPKGERIMFSPRPEIDIRDAKTGALLRSFDCSPYYCSGARWSPEGRRLALHDTMGNVWILDTLPEAESEEEPERGSSSPRERSSGGGD